MKQNLNRLHFLRLAGLAPLHAADSPPSPQQTDAQTPKRDPFFTPAQDRAADGMKVMRKKKNAYP